MKCLACDRILTDGEDKRVFAESGKRVELCNNCVAWVDLPMVGGDDPLDQELPDETSFEEERYEHLSDET